MIYNDYENELTDKLSALFFCIYPLRLCIHLKLLTVTVFLRYKIGVFVSTPYIMRSILYEKELKDIFPYAFSILVSVSSYG